MPKASRSIPPGYVSEGSGENVFVVRDGKIHTPPLGSSVLPGITRDTVIQLAQSLEIPVVETPDSARDALHRRRSVLHRHRGRGHADPLGGSHHDRRKAGGVPSLKGCSANFSASSRADAGSVWLADTGGAAGGDPLTNRRRLKKGGTPDCLHPPFKDRIGGKLPRGNRLAATSPETDTLAGSRRNLLTFVPSRRRIS